MNENRLFPSKVDQEPLKQYIATRAEVDQFGDVHYLKWHPDYIAQLQRIEEKLDLLLSRQSS